MRPIPFLCVLLGLLLVGPPAGSQNVKMEHPEDIHAQKLPTTDDLRSRISNLQLQKDGKDLADLSATIPADMDALKRGVLDKDVIEKLKRVEKLAKRVREELTR